MNANSPQKVFSPRCIPLRAGRTKLEISRLSIWRIEIQVNGASLIPVKKDSDASQDRCFYLGLKLACSVQDNVIVPGHTDTPLVEPAATTNAEGGGHAISFYYVAA
jgi:hypothetical protein